MATVCALVSGTFSFFFSFVWTVFNGGSVAGFFLIYFILGNLIFVALLACCYAAAFLQNRRHSRIFRSRLAIDRLV